MNRKLLVYLALIVAVIFWSLSFIWYRIAFEHYSPKAIITFRLLISAALLFVAGGVVGKIEKMRFGDLKLIILMAVFEPFAYSLCEANGLTMVSPTLAAVIVATIPLFSPIGAFLFLKERINITTAIGIAFSVIGVTLVAYQDDAHIAGSALGIALMFGAVLASIGYAIGLKKMARRYNSITIVAYQNLAAGLMVLPIFLSKEDVTSAMFDIHNLRPIFELSFFASTIAFVLYAYSMKHLTISKVNVFINLIPVFTAVAAYFLLHDHFSAINIAGIVITLAALYISQINFKHNKQ